MRYTALASVVVALSLLTACERTPPAPPANVAAAPAPAPAANPAPVPEAAPVIATWGPRSTAPGVAVNVQKDGKSGLWIKATGRMFLRGTVVTFDGQPIDEIYISPKGDVLTMLVPVEYTSTPGLKHIAVRPSATAAEIPVGDFEVTQ
jgi:hypothetical protein